MIPKQDWDLFERSRNHSGQELTPTALCAPAKPSPELPVNTLSAEHSFQGQLSQWGFLWSADSAYASPVWVSTQTELLHNPYIPTETNFSYQFIIPCALAKERSEESKLRLQQTLKEKNLEMAAVQTQIILTMWSGSFTWVPELQLNHISDTAKLLGYSRTCS